MNENWNIALQVQPLKLLILFWAKQIRKTLCWKHLSESVKINVYSVADGVSHLKLDTFLIRYKEAQFLTQDGAKWMNSAFCSGAGQYA